MKMMIVYVAYRHLNRRNNYYCPAIKPLQLWENYTCVNFNQWKNSVTFCEIRKFFQDFLPSNFYRFVYLTSHCYFVTMKILILIIYSFLQQCNIFDKAPFLS
jgi:hypothetical protein